MLTLKAQPLPSAAETPSIANTMLIGMVASAIDLENRKSARNAGTPCGCNLHNNSGVQRLYRSEKKKHDKA